MMNNLKIFNNDEFGRIRTLVIGGEPWLVGKDVAKALGYKDTSDALKKHVEKEDKLTRRFADSGQNREMYVVNESGLYAVIFGSKLPSAKRFKHWVTSEVLPTIRKTGAYLISTSFEYPVSPATLESATNAGRLFERIMKQEGVPPHEIAMAVRNIFLQAGVDIPEYVIKIPAYEQMSLEVIMR